MAILTRSALASEAREKGGYVALEKSLQTRMFSESAALTSIFLSHSHLDKDVVKDAKIFFENLGVSVYVDWADETMPEKTDGNTAQKIKNQNYNKKR